MAMHVTASTDAAGATDTAHLLILARLEGKVDVALAQQSAILAEHSRRLDDHEPRLRAVESRPEVPEAVDVRLRALDARLRETESRPTVSPAKAMTGAGVIAGIVAAASPFLDRLYS